MKATKIADRYAKALLQEALSKGNLEEVHQDMKKVASEVRKNRDLRILLSSPVIRTANKISVLDKIWGESMNPTTMGSIHQICQKGREMYLRNIANRFIERYKKEKGILTAEVRTANPLDEGTRNAVLEKVRKEEGQEVDLIEHVEPDLIGGILLKVGDRQYDGTILKRLRKFRAAYRA